MLLLKVKLSFEFLSRIAFSVLKVYCYQQGSCVGGDIRVDFSLIHRAICISIETQSFGRAAREKFLPIRNEFVELCNCK